MGDGFKGIPLNSRQRNCLNIRGFGAGFLGHWALVQILVEGWNVWSKDQQDSMGKGWKNKNRNWNPRDNHGKGGYQQHDFASCRGYGIILGTCDAAKERETSKEMVNLVVEAIERVYPESLIQKEEEVVEEEQAKVDKGSLSIADLMKQEISQVKAKKASNLATAVSIKTDVKGIALVKLLKHEYCPIELVLNIFKKIEAEKKSCCRYTVRLVPLKYVFFPKEEDFKDNIEKILNAEMGIPIPVRPQPPQPSESSEVAVGEKREREENEEESTDDPATKHQKVEVAPVENVVAVPPPAPVYPAEKIRFVMHFKARNHNVLVKNFVNDYVNRLVNGYAVADYRQAKIDLVIEALKNICGVSCFPSEEYHKYEQFNIRRYQQETVTDEDEDNQKFSRNILKKEEPQNDVDEESLSGENEEDDNDEEVNHE